MIKMPELTRTLCCAIIACLLSLAVTAQVPEVIEVSYQEVTTRIRSQVTDENGNTYYAGNFKGALVVEGDTLAYGLGGEDYFLLKKLNTGSVDWVIPFGSVQSDNFGIHCTWIRGHLYLHFGLNAAIIINNQLIGPLYAPQVTWVTIKLNANGQAIWTNRSNINLSHFQDVDGGSIAAVGLGPQGIDVAKMENETIYNYNGQYATLMTKITQDGHFLSCHPFINSFSATSRTELITRNSAQKNRFYFLVSQANSGTQTGNNAFNINGTIIPLEPPNTKSLLVKTDTSFNVIAYKILNPTGSGFYSGGTTAENRIQFSEDSTALHLFANFGTYTLDGFNENFNGKIGLVILDTNLITKEVKIFFQNTIFNNIQRINCQFIKEYNSQFFVFGTLIGNQLTKGGPQLPENNQLIPFGNNQTVSFDFNGTYKSFILKTNKNLEYIDHIWLGDHYVQEEAFLNMTNIQFAFNKIRFNQLMDNTWNPWELNLNLQQLQGGSKPLADQADYIERVAYFSNKSKLILGYAIGYNAFDQNTAGITKSNTRRDFFYACFDSAQNMLKYNRISSSFANSFIGKVINQNGKISFILTLTSPRNRIGFNYYKLGNDSATITNSFQRLFITIDSTGYVGSIDIDNTPIGSIIDFDYFDNGDLAVMTSINAIAYNLNGLQFPTNTGFYIARMSPSFQIIQALKFFNGAGPSPTPRQVSVIKGSDDFQYLISPTIFPNGGDLASLIISRGNNNNNVRFYANPLPNAITTKYYQLTGKSNFAADMDFSFIGPFSGSSVASFSQIKNKSYLLFNIFANDTDDLLFNGNLLLSNSNQRRAVVLGLDENTNLESMFIGPASNTIGPSSFTTNNIKAVSNHLYLSGGQANDLSFGALNIPHKGEGDGLILKLDTALNLVQYYRVASIYSDFCTDIDFHPDSSFMIAYRSQGSPTPTVGQNQVSLLQTASGILTSDLEESGYVSLMPSALAPRDFVFTIKNGNWNDATIWNTGKVPVAADRVFVRHKVQVLQAAECHQLFVDPASDLKVGDGIEIRIAGVETE